MATCNLCHRSGIFLKLAKLGVCSNCAPGAAIEINSRWRVIQESMLLISKSKNIDTRLSRCNDLLSNARALLRYEQAGVRFQMPPSVLIQTYSAMPGVIVLEGIMEEARKADQKLAIAATPKARMAIMSKLLLAIQESKARVLPDKFTMNLETRTRAGLHELQLQTYLEEAHKAEFKNNKKKALDQYYEALYFLQHDEIDDRLQGKAIVEIQNKIEELSGKKPEIIDGVAS